MIKIKSIKSIVGKKLVDGTLPDIDSDFDGSRRPEVKAYIEERFGKEQVVSVGSFSTLKVRGIIKDIDRQFDNDVFKANLMTSIIKDEDSTMYDVYKRSASEPKLKEYISKNTDIFYYMPLILGQNKIKSVHPCAVVIVPSSLETHEWFPTRVQGGLTVSEWDGYELDSSGFLKQDILGIKQLDKFSDILKMIEKNGKEKPDIYDLPHDKDVFRYFGNGWNSDVFQFGTDSLAAYTKSMKPQNLEDLIAANALYRPGPMENHYHEIYIKCKNEGRLPEFLWGTEDITSNTFGMVIYQEQIMAVFEKVGGLSLLEADDVRRAMGKKKVEVLQSWREKVKEGFTSKSCTDQEFDEVWSALQEFAKYGFNRSHSAAYAMTGYISQYLKVNFPLEYWTVALDYSDEVKGLKFLSEIFSAKQIKVQSPDVNQSEVNMTSSNEKKTIYWGIESIKGIGEKTAEQIINIRKDHGPYLNFMDFYSKNKFKGSAVKKQTYESLIASGAFDELHPDISRSELINLFREHAKVKLNEKQLERDPYSQPECVETYWWDLRQKSLTGLVFIDYNEIAQQNQLNGQWATTQELSSRQDRGIYRGFGGYVLEFKEGTIKKGKYARVVIENNYRMYDIIIWPEQYKELRNDLTGCEKSILLFHKAQLKFDGSFSKKNKFTFLDETEIKVLK